MTFGDLYSVCRRLALYGTGLAHSAPDDSVGRLLPIQVVASLVAGRHALSRNTATAFKTSARASARGTRSAA
jgi:hypothetical protein